MRNPECWLERSNQSPYGAVRGKVMDDLGTILNQVRVSGASKPTDINYGASYTYALNKYDGYQQFGDVSAYNINYYIGRAAAGSITLTFTKTGYTTQTMGVTINGGQDNPLSTVVMP